jgi:hypothetical protein
MEDPFEIGQQVWCYWNAAYGQWPGTVVEIQYKDTVPWAVVQCDDGSTWVNEAHKAVGFMDGWDAAMQEVRQSGTHSTAEFQQAVQQACALYLGIKVEEVPPQDRYGSNVVQLAAFTAPWPKRFLYVKMTLLLLRTANCEMR